MLRTPVRWDDDMEDEVWLLAEIENAAAEFHALPDWMKAALSASDPTDDAPQGDVVI